MLLIYPNNEFNHYGLGVTGGNDVAVRINPLRERQCRRVMVAILRTIVPISPLLHTQWRQVGLPPTEHIRPTPA